MNNQKGFTLIELIVVIVILGILSAVALPKFMDLSSDAESAIMESVEGSMRSANSMIYAKASMANPSQMKATGAVKIGSLTIDTVYGFAKNATELVKAMDITATDFTIAEADIRYAGATDPEKCIVVYTVASISDASAASVDGDGAVTAAIPAILTPPVYATTTTGC